MSAAARLLRRTATVAGFAALLAGPAQGQDLNALFHPEPPRVPGVEMPLLARQTPATWNPLGLAHLGTDPPPLRLARAGGPARAARPVGPNPSDILLIPALFSDSDEPHIPASELQRVLFDGPTAKGTFVDFYRETSRDMASPSGHVTDWVRTSVTMLEAAGSQNGHGWIGPQRVRYVTDAVQAVDPVVDFRLYDNDGPDGVPDSGDDDGMVDALVIEFLEIAGSCGGPSIWPHFGGAGGGWPTDDIGQSGLPIRVGPYFTQGVTDCGGVAVQGPNVMAHEYGHLLGLPDIYQAVDGIEPEKRHWNIGCFGLMGAGSWGCGTGSKAESFGPVHLSVLMKNWLGWMEIEAVGQVREKTFWLEPAQSTGRGLSIDLGGWEYFLLEYRPRIGFDQDLPAGGVLLYHYDEAWDERSVPSWLPPAKLYHLVEADSDHALRKTAAQGGNRGVAEDVFGLPGRTGPYSSAQGPVRLLTHEGRAVPVTLHEMVVEEGGARARVVLSTHPDPAVMAAETTAGLRILDEGPVVTLRLAGGALPYMVTPTSPDFDVTAQAVGTTVLVEGRALAAGDVALTLQVRDALGRAVDLEVPVAVGDISMTTAELVDAALLSTGDALARDYLDARGNRNGQPDVGDLRAVLRVGG